MRIAVDAMGGDHAPGQVVQGALQAARDNPAEEVVLVGDRDRVGTEAEASGGLPTNARLVHASEVVGMDESPVEALRRKRDSSIGRAVGLLKAGEVEAVVSAGNTGAVVAASTLSLRLLPGVRKPGIAATFPTLAGHCTVMDVGANIKPRPQHLVQYAVMASAYHRHVLGHDRSRVGLLNIGEEGGKGNELVREAHRLLETAPVDYAGNQEGQDLFRGECDVFVCEGFVGNLILKVAEGLGVTLLEFLRREVQFLFRRDLDHLQLDELSARLQRRVDYAEYGGAPLLGIDGLVVICHGRSDARAMANALAAAWRFASLEVNRHIVEGLSRLDLGAAEGGVS